MTTDAPEMENPLKRLTPDQLNELGRRVATSSR